MTPCKALIYSAATSLWKLSITLENASRNQHAIWGRGQRYWNSFDLWSTDTSPESTIMWLHGCAGAGKSAIVQMFAGNIQREGRLGASFFFKRGHTKRGTWHSLIPTISYQLAMSVPALLLPIQQAVEHDKLVVGRAMAVSFEQLLVEPLKNVQGLQHIPVIVLDGLDECADHKVQQQICDSLSGQSGTTNSPSGFL
ncbi:hypothetical protein DFH09DRAFT_1380806 [Mycena vulgaris]|nr:hypothetical protein DFH09DRAFT_1380806 [Mycena vulgaris]